MSAAYPVRHFTFALTVDRRVSRAVARITRAPLTGCAVARKIGPSPRDGFPFSARFGPPFETSLSETYPAAVALHMEPVDRAREIRYALARSGHPLRTRLTGHAIGSANPNDVRVSPFRSPTRPWKNDRGRDRRVTFTSPSTVQ